MENSDEIMRALGRIEGKLQTISDMPERVRKLENGQARFTGIGLVLGAIGSWILAKVGLPNF